MKLINHVTTRIPNLPTELNQKIAFVGLLGQEKLQ